MHLPVVGCVGTAKNTGKTTALSAIGDQARRSGRRVAFTSIGYDGEELDALTGLPKPRVRVYPGDLVATARPCLDVSPGGWRVVADSGISTALGPLVIARATAPGRVVLAGPAHRHGLARLGRLLAARCQPDLLLVDGAFGRLSPLARARGLVVCTGAARARDPDALGREVGAIRVMLSLPRSRLRGRRVRHLLEERVPAVAGWLARGETVLVLGMVTLAGLVSLGEAAGARGQGTTWGQLVFADAVQLLLAGPAEGVVQAAQRLDSMGLSLAVGGGPAILAVTVNPFFPRPLEAGRFEAAFVDPDELKARVTRHLGGAIPVVDVKRDGPRPLWRAVEEVLIAGGPREAGEVKSLPGTLRGGIPPEVRGVDPGGPGRG